MLFVRITTKNFFDFDLNNVVVDCNLIFLDLTADDVFIVEIVTQYDFVIENIDDGKKDHMSLTAYAQRNVSENRHFVRIS